MQAISDGLLITGKASVLKLRFKWPDVIFAGNVAK